MPKVPAKTLEQIDAEINPQETPEDKRTAKKEFVVQRNDNGLYSIAYTAGGEVPDELKGLWTNINKATNAIDNYKLKAALG